MILILEWSFHDALAVDSDQTSGTIYGGDLNCTYTVLVFPFLRFHRRRSRTVLVTYHQMAHFLTWKNVVLAADADICGYQ